MLTEPAIRAALAEDVGNIVALEHVNVTIPDQSIATAFYVLGLGFTRDPYLMVGLNNMWVNLGDQQFHLPTQQPQRLRGHTGLVVPSLDGLRRRLESVAPLLEGTQFTWQESGSAIVITGPWGNRFRCYGPDAFPGMTRGISYVELAVPVGTADGIAHFYAEIFQAPTQVDLDEAPVARVLIGTNQELRFRETDDPIPEYDGHHIAIYVASFSRPYQQLHERGLVTQEVARHQFRFVEIVDPITGRRLFELEHEVRSLRHPGFRRPLVNRELD